MKYLKHFESLTSPHTKRLYSGINLFEWQDLSKKSNENFTESESNKLQELNNKVVNQYIFKLRPWIRFNKLLQYYYYVDVNLYGLSIYYSSEKDPSHSRTFQERLIQVLKLTDEWFICQIPGQNGHTFYKCDTFDGLLQLLNDLAIK